MVGAEIVVYFEGDTVLRSAMSKFLNPLREEARVNQLGIRVVACGDKGRTQRRFDQARDSHKLLLIDSDEYPPKDTSDRRHYMVQMMESWFLGDWEVLSNYFRTKEDDPNKGRDIEQIPKGAVESILKELASGRSKPYHKTIDAPRLLAAVKLESVCKRSFHCNRLRQNIRDVIAHTVS
jgi:hypothetical protein